MVNGNLAQYGAPVPHTHFSIKNSALGEGLQDLGGVGFFQKFFPAVVGIGFVIGIVLFFFMMITGAIQWITSGGDKASLEAARGKVGNAIIGLVILFLILALIKVLETFFGIDILTIDIGPLKIE